MNAVPRLRSPRGVAIRTPPAAMKMRCGWPWLIGKAGLPDPLMSYRPSVIESSGCTKSAIGGNHSCPLRHTSWRSAIHSTLLSGRLDFSTKLTHRRRRPSHSTYEALCATCVW